MSQQIHFVHETKPGTALDSNQVRALRSHVRKVNLERSTQKSTRRLENFRSLTITDFSESGKIKSGKKRQPSTPGATHSLELEIEDLPSREVPANILPLILPDPAVITHAFQVLPSPKAEKLATQCTCTCFSPVNQQLTNHSQSSSPALSSYSDERHPYALHIAKKIGFDEARIEYLLKSCKSQNSCSLFRTTHADCPGAFQIAAEPFIASSGIDGDLESLSVFPECLSNSAFLYALFYAIIHVHNSCHTTSESLFLKTKAIEYLREDLHNADCNIRALSVGTILLLSCVAVRLEISYLDQG